MSKWLEIPTEPPTRYRDDTLLMPGPEPDIPQTIINSELEKIGLGIETVLTAAEIRADLMRLLLYTVDGPVDAWPALRQLRDAAAANPTGALSPAAVIGISLEYETDNGATVGALATGSTGVAGAVIEGGAYSPSGPPKS